VASPWLMLIALAALNVAIGMAALYLHRGGLHLAAMVASSLIVLAWAAGVDAAPWPAAAAGVSVALVLFALAWIRLARRAGVPDRLFGIAAVAATVLAQFLIIMVSVRPGAPEFAFVVLVQALLLVVLLGLSWFCDWGFLAPAAVFPATLALIVWRAEHSGVDYWGQTILFAGILYLIFLAYPLVLQKRVGRLLSPYLASVLAGAPFLLLARQALIQAGYQNVMGALALLQAALTGAHLLQLLRLERPGARMQGRLALVAATVLAFITVAVPLQLEKHWVTVGWALEGAALAWLLRKIPHRGLLLASFGLLAAVFVRLVMNPAVFEYYARGNRIWNWYLYAYLVSAFAMFLAGRLLSRTDDTLEPGVPRASALLPGGGTILLFWLLNIEIADFYSTGRNIVFNFNATLAQDLTYTLGWGLFALALLGAGIAIRSRPARIGSLALLAATILKCFLHDLARLGGLYRVGSFVGLAVCLALVAVLLQKYVLARPRADQ